MESPKSNKTESFVNDQKTVVVDSKAEMRAVRKLDYSILPIVSMFYLLSFLVRSPGSLQESEDSLTWACRIAPTLVTMSPCRTRD
jgi:hypothetical protein